MAKKRSRKFDLPAYLAVRALLCVIETMPMSWGHRIARLLARLLFRLDRRFRAVARENLGHAFPEWADDTAKLDDLILRTYDHFLRMMVDIARYRRRVRLYKRRHVEPGSTADGFMAPEVGNRRLLAEALTCGRPVMVVGGHFGNWEFAVVNLGLFGVRAHAIARELDNPYLERFFKAWREQNGGTIHSKHGDFDGITDALAENGVLCTMADQDAGRKGLFVEFFNRPASTHKAIALMAMESNAVIVVGGAPRVAEPDVYRLEIVDMIRTEDYADRPDAIREITQRFTTALEGLIRRYPEQYLWLHRRWKSQPKVSKRRAA